MAEEEVAVDRATVLAYAAKIPWENYVGAGKAPSGSAVFVDAADVRAIKRFALEEQTAIAEFMATGDAEAARYPGALFKVLLNIKDVRILQFALTLIEDFLAHDAASRAKFFAKPGEEGASTAPYMLPFLQLVGTAGSGARVASVDADPYIMERAAGCAALLLSVTPTDTASVAAMLAWVLGNLKLFGSGLPKQVKVTEVALSSLMVLLRCDYLRGLFVEEGGVERLVPLLTTRNTQMLYEAVFCLWSLSLHVGNAVHLERAGAVTAVSCVARVGMPNKVLRMALAFLANVARQKDVFAEALAEICECHVGDVVDALLGAEAGSAAVDAEMAEDLAWLKEAIASNRRKLTSIERFEKDIKAKRLEWTSTHSAEFWKENAVKFEADDFRLLRALVDLLLDATADETTLAVALHDIGEFAVNHPMGRQVLQALGVRPTVMSFLKRDEDEIKSQALLACSKMMITNWKHVAGATA